MRGCNKKICKGLLTSGVRWEFNLYDLVGTTDKGDEWVILDDGGAFTSPATDYRIPKQPIPPQRINYKEWGLHWQDRGLQFGWIDEDGNEAIGEFTFEDERDKYFIIEQPVPDEWTNETKAK